MDFRNFGTTNLKVSALGFGAGEIGDFTVADKTVDIILNTALDLGINLIDTARGYFASEERIGKFISHRRNEFMLSTKVGYGVEGEKDWSYNCILKGIDEALIKMKTDVIDIVHLHTCGLEVLKSGEVMDALDKAKTDGKIKLSAYSGENENLNYAINIGRFDSVQSSFNICDQRNLYSNLPKAKEKGLGFIAKRPIANAPWRFSERPTGHYCEEYWLRFQNMNLNIDMDLYEAALRFSAYTWGIDSCIVGTTDLNHLKRNVEIIEKGKLPEDIIKIINEAFQKNDVNWVGQE